MTGPHGIMFHHFHGGGHPAVQGSIDAPTLERLIERLGRERFLPAAEWLERARSDRLAPGDLVLTFDDALRCQVDVALPVLERLGLTAFWFVNSGVLQGEGDELEIFRFFRTTCFDDLEAFYAAFERALATLPEGEAALAAVAAVDTGRYLADFPFYSAGDRRFRWLRDRALSGATYRAAMRALMAAEGFDETAVRDRLWLSGDRVRALSAAGHEIGLHSHSHPTTLARLSAAEQRAEYETNLAVLGALSQRPPRSMSHPCNSYGPETLALLRALGIAVGFRANMQPAGGDRLELPREDHANLCREFGLPCA